jgi:hypothetical protein
MRCDVIPNRGEAAVRNLLYRAALFRRQFATYNAAQKRDLLMEDPKQVSDISHAVPSSDKSAAIGLLWFGLHLAAVYVIAEFCWSWLAGHYYDWVLPVVDPVNHVSYFQFLYSHLFAFTFLPALAAGAASMRFRRTSALFVWIVPTVVLAYKLVTFPTTLFQNHYAVAFHYYFAGGFLIGEFHNYRELFTVVAGNPDAIRGLEQSRFTGPFYAGLGYSLAAWIAPHARAFILANMPRTPSSNGAEEVNSKNTADTACPSAPAGTPHRE